MARSKQIIYGLTWNDPVSPLAVEMAMIRAGGQAKRKDGVMCGLGLLGHWQNAKKLIWPDFKHHRWDKLRTEEFLSKTYIAEMGCAAGGKSQSAACNFLLDWYIFPTQTTTLVTSTTIPSLELRVWGQMKAYHKVAKERYPWLPGHLIEGRRMITLNARDLWETGRDFRNGIIAVPVQKGNAFVGLGSLVGIHNKRVRLLADECNLCPRGFLDATANLSKAEDFKMMGLGNPNETTNAHGTLCEPAADLGGWDAGLDQQPKTKTWRTRFPNGVCIQTPGNDSPNMDAPPGEPPPFPFLITRKNMEDDAQIWGINDWHYEMMNNGRMPRGQGARRVITRAMCERHHALDGPIWRDSRITKIAALDAAYRGVGGDRCVFAEMQFGVSAESPAHNTVAVTGALANGDPVLQREVQLIALIDLLVIPIEDRQGVNEAEDQIVNFVKEQCDRRGIPPSNLFFDAAMRTSLVTAFSRLWSPLVNSIDSNARCSERPVTAQLDVKCCDYYSKFVTEMWYSVRLAIEAGQFRGLTQDAMAEGCIREFKQTAGNKIEVETKADMKLKSGRSPDLFDCVAYGVEGARQRGFVISKIGAATPAAQLDDRWRRALRVRAGDLWRGKDLDYSA